MAVGKVGNEDAEDGSARNIVNIVSVIIEAGNGNHEGAEEGR